MESVYYRVAKRTLSMHLFRHICCRMCRLADRETVNIIIVGDRAFPVAAARLWNSPTSHVTAAPLSLHLLLSSKSQLFSLSYPAFRLFSHLYSARAVARHFGHYNRHYT